ncbi:hypothetical protein [Tenggerimyces flavus]|uniref:Uncharacterized protein n=1 Tax=Tenggerimyces flavus TaxID=1708749 RepID=A0ABV7Y206_9ACTN|nr:hypothetical protein [Tenggerimyces flavus]MBM7790861.1 hypothetical protein [Tenggerimyces flavus]
MTAKAFVERFIEAQRAFGSARPLLPTAVVGAWRDVVDECERGYAMSIYEYDNDLDAAADRMPPARRAAGGDARAGLGPGGG